MAIGELIQPYDSLNVGRIKINNFYSGNTILWSGSVGSDSIIRGNVAGDLGNLALSTNSIAAGKNNTTSGTFAMSFWGSGNTASSTHTTIVSGLRNSNSGAYSFIGAGSDHKIVGSTFSVITGGAANSASTGNCNFIGAGLYNRVSADRSIIVGGRDNLVRGNYSSIIGGRSNVIEAPGFSTILNGRFNTANTGAYSTVIAGASNVTLSTVNYGFIQGWNNMSFSNTYSQIMGRGSYLASSQWSSIVGGNSNKIKYTRGCFLGGGDQNTGGTNANLFIGNPVSIHSGIIGGKKNHVNAHRSFIAGGYGNVVSMGLYTSFPYYSFLPGGGAIIAGFANRLVGNGSQYSFIGGGYGNVMSPYSGPQGYGKNAMIGGKSNVMTAYASFSVMAGGTNNIMSSLQTGSRNVMIGGMSNFIGNPSQFAGTFAGRSNNVSGTYGVTLGGKGNKVSHAWGVAMGGGSETRGNFQFVIGNVNTNVPNPANNTIRLDGGLGKAFLNGGIGVGPADYAEFFEWSDKNINSENRLGYFVSLVDDKIEIGNSNLLGIISVSPAVAGDSAENAWSEMYLKDDWGLELQESYKKYEWTETTIVSGKSNDDHNSESDIINYKEIKTSGSTTSGNTNNFEHIDLKHSGETDSSNIFEKCEKFIIFEDESGNKFKHMPCPSFPKGLAYTGETSISATTEIVFGKKMNPKYNTDTEYIPRSERKEWAPVGLLGKLRVRTAEPITSKKVSVNSQGLAINGNKYDVLETIRPHSQSQYGIVKIFFR